MLSPEEQREQDLRLIEEFKKTEELEVLGRLYQPYMSLVYGVCLKYMKNRDESQDMVMQIFEKLIRSVKEHEIANFRSWLYVIAKNQCLMALRSSKGKHFEEISPLIMESDTAWHLEEERSLENDLSKLEKCINKLGDEQKACVQLFFLQQKCYNEITDITGYDFKKVKSHIQNGKRNLKICMEENG